MTQSTRLAGLFVIAQFFLVPVSPVFAQSPGKTNVLVILADDLGYSDLGCHGGEIATPNLDQLATNGLRFTNFYNTGRCWPTRAALMTGYYAQQVRFDVLPGDPPLNRDKRPGWAKLLPELLKSSGYRSFHSGKWHLDGGPVAGGFDRSYSLDDHGRYFSPQLHLLNDKPLPKIERDSGYYATKAVADHAIRFLKEHQSDFSEQPFFGFVAFTAPHFPLHALPEDIAKYTDRYLAGWNQLRQERFERIRDLGLVKGSLSAVEPDVGPPYDHPNAMEKFGPDEVNRPLSWDELTAEQKQFQATKMAIHAAMVDRMDQEIGRIIEQLRVMGCYENTLVLFLSDNGASAEIMVRDDGHDPNALPGSAATHLCLGPGWSSASNTPFRRHKSWVHEGGIHTPLIAHWHTGIQSQGQLNHSIGHVIDIVPTVLELAGAENPEAEDGVSKPQSPGTSLLGAFRENATIDRGSLWWCHEGNRALRDGPWKLVAAKGEPWELFNLADDPTEQTNLGNKYPERLSAMKTEWNRQLKQMRQDILDSSEIRKRP